MSVWGALAGGAVGAVVLASGLRVAQEVGWTRFDLPLLLGTVFTENRRRAKALGYICHFVLGVVFAMLYFVFFRVIGRSAWWIGALLGIVQAAFTVTVLVNVLLPAVHPRMGTPETAADETSLIEPPGFLMLNYGRSSTLVAVAAHVVYGTILGLIIQV